MINIIMEPLIGSISIANTVLTIAMATFFKQQRLLLRAWHYTTSTCCSPQRVAQSIGFVNIKRHFQFINYLFRKREK